MHGQLKVKYAMRVFKKISCVVFTASKHNLHLIVFLPHYFPTYFRPQLRDFIIFCDEVRYYLCTGLSTVVSLLFPIRKHL